MKSRVITSVVGLLLLGAVFAFFETPVFVIAISALSVIAVFELIYATGILTEKRMLAVTLIFAGIVPFIFALTLKAFAFKIVFTYSVVMCALFLLLREKVMFTSFSTAFLMSIFIPSAFSLMIVLRDKFGELGPFFIALIFTAAWFSDTGAYFAGRYFGKRKLAPSISPNKTVEGFIGGILTATIGFFLITKIYEYVIPLMYGADINLSVNYLYLLLIAPICSAVGVCGDLFASVIKRQTGIKDFGKIMPGHGGIMDRFDSFLFVAPALFVCVHWLPVAAIVRV